MSGAAGKISTAEQGALRLLSRFSLAPNSLGYCGRNSAGEKFKKCITKGLCRGVPREIERFIVLNPYLDTLAKITGKSKYSYEIAEAYWIGNSELKKAKPRHYGLLLENFAKQEVPAWLIEELHKKKPDKFIPFHLFQVLHIGVGKASGSVPYSLESINNCMLRWGTVVKLTKKRAVIKLNSLEKVSKKYRLVNREEAHPYHLEITPEISVGSVAAVHWKQVLKILTPEETEKLNFWTREVIKSHTFTDTKSQ